MWDRSSYPERVTFFLINAESIAHLIAGRKSSGILPSFDHELADPAVRELFVRGMTEVEIANRSECSTRSVRRWLRRDSRPSPAFRLALDALVRSERYSSLWGGCGELRAFRALHGTQERRGCSVLSPDGSQGGC